MNLERMVSMSKKKVKELLFDINTNEITEIDENGEKIDSKIEKDLKDKNLDLLFEQNKKTDVAEENNKVMLKEKYKELNKSLSPKLQDFKVKMGKSYNALKSKTLNQKDKAKAYIEKTKKEEHNVFDKIQALFKKDKKIVYIIIGMLTLGIGGYSIYYSLAPDLDEAKGSYENSLSPKFNSEVHPLELFSTNIENLIEFKGEPESQGDGSSSEARYIVYKMNWFGENRDTAIYYDKNTSIESLKIKIGDVPAETLYQNYVEMFGAPKVEENPTIKGGFAIFIKDGIQVKLMHNGTYMSVDMRLAKYDNVNNLALGENPIIVQNILDYDINEDGKNDKILLIGNKSKSSTLYEKLYLLVWDGTKTYLEPMPEAVNGGSYPQLILTDTDKDKINEILVSSGNNDIIRNYNVFEYKAGSVANIYSGHNEKFE